MPTPNTRSSAISVRVMASTGLPGQVSAGRVDRPDEQRQSEPGQSRRAHFVNRYDEIQSGCDGTKTRDENPRRHCQKWPLAYVLE